MICIGDRCRFNLIGDAHVGAIVQFNGWQRLLWRQCDPLGVTSLLCIYSGLFVIRQQAVEAHCDSGDAYDSGGYWVEGGGQEQAKLCGTVNLRIPFDV